jgi:two-component system, OmpR family, alkaline phosphatase synthesis response regulator PhoP
MGKKVLLIEDEYFISYLYKRQLELVGIPTDTFATAAEGIQALKTNHYDLLLLDMMLPDSDGIEILKKIRADEQIKNTPVIIMTNLSQEAVIQDAKNLGAIDYLIKSQVDPEDIVKKVNDFLAQLPPQQSGT